MKTTAVTAEDLIAAAEEMIPALIERAPKEEQLRRLSDETVDEFRKSSILRVLQPKRYGGLELDPHVFGEIHIALARGDMSAAWVFGVYSGHNHHLAAFDDRAQRDVWGDNPDAVISSSSLSVSTSIVPVAGGYRLTGRWKFSSGCHHAEWIMAGAPTTEDKPKHLVFLMPRADVEIVDVWDVMGLRGTGSNDIVLHDVFVPSYRTIEFPASMTDRLPGHEVNDGPLYRMPYLQIFFRGITTGGIGGLQAMLDAYVKYAGKKVNSKGSRSAADPDNQLACAEAYVAINEMKTTMMRNYDILMAAARAGTKPSLLERRMMKYQASEVPDRCLSHARRLFEGTGGLGVFNDQGPFERIYRNLIAMRNHTRGQYRVDGRTLGADLLGESVNDMLL